MYRCVAFTLTVVFVAVPCLADEHTDASASAVSHPFLAPPIGSGGALDDLGDIVFGPIDLEFHTLEVGNLGVQFLNGKYFVTARGQTALDHTVWVFDDGGNGLLGEEFVQHPNALGSLWGYRDGATDGTFLYFGCELGIYRHDADGSNAIELISGGGPTGNYRALAYDPTGDGGSGSFWSANHASALVEVSMTGATLTTFPNGGWGLYGLEYDPFTGNLWGHHSEGGRPPLAAPQIVEIDTNTGQMTGRAFVSDGGLPPSGTEPFVFNGGLTGVPGGAGGTGNAWDIVGLVQAEFDNMIGFEIYVTPPSGCAGDLDGDGDTDLADLGILLADFGCAAPGPCAGDLDGDGDTDLADLGILLADFGCTP